MSYFFIALDATSVIPNVTPWALFIVNPLLSTPVGLFISNILQARAYLRRGLFKVAKKIVPVLHEELECRVEKLKYKKLEVMQPRIKSKSKLPADW